MSQHENITELPLGSRVSAFAGTTASSVASNTITLAALPSGLAANSYIRSGNRLYVVTSLVKTARQITVWPEGLIAASDPVDPAPTVRVRFTSKATRSPRSGGFAGPWSVSVREAV